MIKERPSTPTMGFNENVAYKGRVFHIQTEDSGHRHPHVISHLFADGGVIVKTKKTSYEAQLDDDDICEKVQTMMRKQHQAMRQALERGMFDYLWDPDALPPASLGKPLSYPFIDNAMLRDKSLDEIILGCLASSA